MHSEIQDAARETIALEQWLAARGWRDVVQRMSSPKADVFLEAAAEFRWRIERLERAAGRWRRVAYGAVAGCVVAVALMASSPLWL